MAVPNITPDTSRADAILRKGQLWAGAVQQIGSILANAITQYSSHIQSGIDKKNDPQYQIAQKRLKDEELESQGVEKLKEIYKKRMWNGYVSLSKFQNGGAQFDKLYEPEKSADASPDIPAPTSRGPEPGAQAPTPKPVDVQATPDLQPVPGEGPEIATGEGIARMPGAEAPIIEQEAPADFGRTMDQQEHMLAKPSAKAQLDPRTEGAETLPEASPQTTSTQPSGRTVGEAVKTNETFEKVKLSQPDFYKSIDDELKAMNPDKDAMLELINAGDQYVALRVKHKTIFGRESFPFQRLMPTQMLRPKGQPSAVSEAKVDMEEWEMKQAPQYLGRMIKHYNSAEIKEARGETQHGTLQDFKAWALKEYGVHVDSPTNDPEAGITNNYMMKMFDTKNSPQMKEMLEAQFPSRAEARAGRTEQRLQDAKKKEPTEEEKKVELDEKIQKELDVLEDDTRGIDGQVIQLQKDISSLTIDKAALKTPEGKKRYDEMIEDLDDKKAQGTIMKMAGKIMRRRNIPKTKAWTLAEKYHDNEYLTSEERNEIISTEPRAVFTSQHKTKPGTKSAETDKAAPETSEGKVNKNLFGGIVDTTDAPKEQPTQTAETEQTKTVTIARDLSNKPFNQITRKDLEGLDPNARVRVTKGDRVGTQSVKVLLQFIK